MGEKLVCVNTYLVFRGENSVYTHFSGGKISVYTHFSGGGGGGGGKLSIYSFFRGENEYGGKMSM